MASIRDVAIKAGVGIGTVSRALNGSGYISDETKQKIMQAVEELNYKPNELAQNLFRNKSGFIGIVVKNLSHPFMASLVKHVENNLYTNGYKCMLCEVGDNPNRIEEFVEMLQRNVMDGIICCADIPSSVSLAEIHRPIVMIDRYVTEGIPCIHSDHKRGGELAAQALLSAGCKNVLYFASSATERGYSMEVTDGLRKSVNSINVKLQRLMPEARFRIFRAARRSGKNTSAILMELMDSLQPMSQRQRS